MTCAFLSTDIFVHKVEKPIGSPHFLIFQQFLFHPFPFPNQTINISHYGTQVGAARTGRVAVFFSQYRLRRFITHYGLEQYGFCRPTVTAIFHELK
jgi:hypothetical protein